MKNFAYVVVCAAVCVVIALYVNREFVGTDDSPGESTLVGGISISKVNPNAQENALTETPKETPNSSATNERPSTTTTTTSTSTTTSTLIEKPSDQAPGIDKQVLDTIDFPWEESLRGWLISFQGPRDGFRGTTYPKEKRIEIYVRPDSTIDQLIHVTAHEIGHALDVEHLTDAERRTFAKARGQHGTQDWWVAAALPDFRSGAGDFAECFAWSQRKSGDFLSQVGPPPTDEQIELLMSLVT